MELHEKILRYIPFCEQEEKDQDYMLKWFDNFDDVLTRNNIFGHFTASALVVNEKRTKMVVVYHKINDGWMYPGGHADGEEDLLSVAQREVEEETGLKARILDQNIFAIQVIPTYGHIKNGAFVSSHEHLDCLFLMEADEDIPLIFREEESKGVKWLNFEAAMDDTIVPFIKPVHAKIIRKLQKEKR